MPTFYQITSFLKYKLFEIDAHSLHSPYLFKLYQDCFGSAKNRPENQDIEALRLRLKQDITRVDIVDYGAGSKLSEGKTRTIKSIAHGGISLPEYSALFQKLIRYFNCKNILELGTSLGINTLYLARSATDVQVWTFEGCSSIADFSSKIFREFGSSNIKILYGNINVALPDLLRNISNIDFVFIDANHTYEATIDYFNLLESKLSGTSIVVIDDIYWSKEMTRAWQDLIKRFPKATCIDIYQCGIIIFDDAIPQGRFIFAYS